jgi:hypothetical protein
MIDNHPTARYIIVSIFIITNEQRAMNKILCRVWGISSYLGADGRSAEDAVLCRGAGVPKPLFPFSPPQAARKRKLNSNQHEMLTSTYQNTLEEITVCQHMNISAAHVAIALKHCKK